MLRLLLSMTLMIAALPLVSNAEVPPLPEEATSFGAAVLDETLYVYGGHTGPAHVYSTADQSDRFLSLGLRNPKEWKECPSGPKLQGLSLIAHGGQLYRLGGFTAMNAEGDDHDLRSQAGVAVYDPAAARWKELSSLPEPRSSFDAAVLGDRVYVFGGWNLQGESDGDWHATAWSADLTKRPLVWEAETDAPFQRRALAVAAHGGKLFAIGGITPEGTTRRVDIYDPTTDEWSVGPELIGERSIDGFGAAVRSTPHGLYVTSLSGALQRLEDDGSKWRQVATLDAPRFFHAMIPFRDGLLLVGGANMSDGKLAQPEFLRLSQPTTADEE